MGDVARNKEPLNFQETAKLSVGGMGYHWSFVLFFFKEKEEVIGRDKSETEFAICIVTAEVTSMGYNEIHCTSIGSDILVALNI